VGESKYAVSIPVRIGNPPRRATYSCIHPTALQTLRMKPAAQVRSVQVSLSTFVSYVHFV
jgi:hypothetical protein